VTNKQNDSPVWSDLLKVRHIYLKDRTFKVNNGKLLSFWLDIWLDDIPLSQRYPALYELCLNQSSSVFDVWKEEWVIKFRVRLHGLLRDQWYALAARLNAVPMNEEANVVIWKWSANKHFSVKSVYDHLSKDVSRPPFKRVWKAKLPEKIKVFMWLVEQKAILTKDNMIKRKWQGGSRVFSVGILKQVTICYLDSLLPRKSGVL
jgi:hypothetical protein